MPPVEDVNFLENSGLYLIHKVRGDHVKSFECLERAFDEHDSFIPWLRVTPIDIYRIPDEPRFKALLKKAGLES